MLHYFNTAATLERKFSLTDWQMFQGMFCISSRICSFNSELLVKNLLLRYPQRKKLIGDKSRLRVGQLMSPHLDTEHNKSEVLHVVPCWFLCSCKCKSLCRMQYKDVLSTFKMLDCFWVENPGCSWTDALTGSKFLGSRDVLGRLDIGWFIFKSVSLILCTHFFNQLNRWSFIFMQYVVIKPKFSTNITFE